MRKFRTGYVVSFNRRHHRTGKLFSTTVTDVARLVGMTLSAISYAVMRGKKIAEEKRLQMIEGLLK